MTLLLAVAIGAAVVSVSLNFAASVLFTPFQTRLEKWRNDKPWKIYATVLGILILISVPLGIMLQVTIKFVPQEIRLPVPILGAKPPLLINVILFSACIYQIALLISTMENVVERIAQPHTVSVALVKITDGSLRRIIFAIVTIAFYKMVINSFHISMIARQMLPTAAIGALVIWVYLTFRGTFGKPSRLWVSLTLRALASLVGVVALALLAFL